MKKVQSQCKRESERKNSKSKWDERKNTHEEKVNALECFVECLHWKSCLASLSISLLVSYDKHYWSYILTLNFERRRRIKSKGSLPLPNWNSIFWIKLYIFLRSRYQNNMATYVFFFLILCTNGICVFQLKSLSKCNSHLF